MVAGVPRIMLIAFNKPFGVLSQFTSAEGKPTLADLIPVKNVYAAGRLDIDSEGLLLLTDVGTLQHAIADPKHGIVKRYWAQVEGTPDAEAVVRLAAGIDIGSGADHYRARPAGVRLIDPPLVVERNPPIRQRARIPTAWLELEIAEGKNRQVRRMTAAIGHPTLRLIRVGIGDLDLASLDLAPGIWTEIEPARLGVVFQSPRFAQRVSDAAPCKSLSTGLRKRRYWG
jgi:23S rRNA pseudouridine2457 synthase